MLKMSLTLSPLVSLDNQLQDHSRDKEGFCGRWILKHKPLVSGPATGTTFPPFSHHLPYYTQKTEGPMAKPCKSEPDLNSDYQNFDEAQDDHDEDYLFEFDIGSPASSEEGNTVDFDQDAIINVIKDEDESAGLERRMSSVSTSESTSSSCSHRKESGVVTDGFSSIFGSISSGFDSEHRSSNSMLGDGEELEGLAVNPEEWKENSALYLGGKLTMAVLRPGEGSATPIMAASPLTTHTSPLVSPDSVISEDLNMSPRKLCEECQLTQSEADQGEPEEKRESHEEGGTLDQETDEIVSTEYDSQEEEIVSRNEAEISQQKSDDMIKRLSAKMNSTPAEKTTEKFQINPSLIVSTEKLNNLLNKLVSDKVYKNQDDSLEDVDEDDRVMSPIPRSPGRDSLDKPRLRKSSSLKTRKTPPTTPGRRKIVRFALKHLNI